MIKHFDEYTKEARWAICRCTSFSELTTILERNSPEGLEIRFSINGVEVDFEKAMEVFSKYFNDQIEIAVSERISEIKEISYDLERAKKTIDNWIEKQKEK